MHRGRARVLEVSNFQSSRTTTTAATQNNVWACVTGHTSGSLKSVSLDIRMSLCPGIHAFLEAVQRRIARFNNCQALRDSVYFSCLDLAATKVQYCSVTAAQLRLTCGQWEEYQGWGKGRACSWQENGKICMSWTGFSQRSHPFLTHLYVFKPYNTNLMGSTWYFAF